MTSARPIYPATTALRDIGDEATTKSIPCGLTPVKIGVTTPVLVLTLSKAFPTSAYNDVFGMSPEAVIA